jgi:hypothetical protein
VKEVGINSYSSRTKFVERGGHNQPIMIYILCMIIVSLLIFVYMKRCGLGTNDYVILIADVRFDPRPGGGGGGGWRAKWN